MMWKREKKINRGKSRDLYTRFFFSLLLYLVDVCKTSGNELSFAHLHSYKHNQHNVSCVQSFAFLLRSNGMEWTIFYIDDCKQVEVYLAVQVFFSTSLSLFPMINKSTCWHMHISEQKEGSRHRCASPDFFFLSFRSCLSHTIADYIRKRVYIKDNRTSISINMKYFPKKKGARKKREEGKRKKTREKKTIDDNADDDDMHQTGRKEFPCNWYWLFFLCLSLSLD